MKVVKIQGWEGQWEERVQKVRDEELKVFRRLARIIGLFINRPFIYSFCFSVHYF